MATRQYIVGARDSATKKETLSKFLAQAQAEKDTKIVSGNVDKHLVIVMNLEAADRLKQQFSKDVILEEDAPLKY